MSMRVPFGGWCRLFVRLRRLYQQFSTTGLLLAMLALVLAPPAVADEQFESYDVQLAIYATGNLFVTETIAANAEGAAIKHGIYRSLDLRSGETLQVLTVRRDGEPEPYAVLPSGTIQQIRIGDADVLVPHGLHRYEISYVVRDAVASDTLTWEVTGRWTLPIRSARAEVVLPTGTTVLGAGGSSLCAARIGEPPPPDETGRFVFTSGPLEPGQSFDLTLHLGAAASPETKLDRQP